MNLVPQFFYRMVVIGLLSIVGDGGGCGGVALGGVGRALGGRWEGVGRALAGGEGVGFGSLIYRQIKSLHVPCSGYLLVDRYVDEIRIRSSFFTSVLDCFRNSLKNNPSRVLLYDK